uniref:Uncharacterized protein n=1 Tax=Anguilla anguilla TaxID=7936 RepID=A0A0E9UVE7_ANGAN
MKRPRLQTPPLPVQQPHWPVCKMAESDYYSCSVYMRLVLCVLCRKCRSSLKVSTVALFKMPGSRNEGGIWL